MPSRGDYEAAAALPPVLGGRYRERLEGIQHARFETETKLVEYAKAERRDQAYAVVTARKWAAMASLHSQIAAGAASTGTNLGLLGADTLRDTLVKRGRERSFSFLAPEPVVSVEHFATLMVACFALDPTMMGAALEHFARASELGGNIDWRDFLCCLMLLDKPKAGARGLLIRFFDMFDIKCTRAVSRDDARRLLHVVAGTLKEEALAEAVLGKVDARHGGRTQAEISLSDFTRVLDDSATFTASYEAMAFARIPNEMQIRVLQERAQASEAVVRDHEIRIKLAKFSRMMGGNMRAQHLYAWHAHVKNTRESRRLRQMSMALYRKREVLAACARWHDWARTRHRHRELMVVAVAVRLRHVAVHCLRGWHELAHVTKKLDDQREVLRLAAHVHAAKNMVRLYFRTLEKYMPSTLKYFPIWKEEAHFITCVERGIIWLERKLMVKVLRAWRGAAEVLIKERWKDEVDATERQEALLAGIAGAEEERRVADEQEKADVEAAKQAALAVAAEEKADAAEVKARRVKAEKYLAEKIMVTVQDEDRRKHKKSLLEEKLEAFHDAHDKMEEALVEAARQKAAEYIQLKPGSKTKCLDPKAEEMLNKTATKLVDLVCAPVHNKKEREKIAAEGTEWHNMPREGGMHWQIRIDEETNSKFYRNVATKETVTQDMVSGSKKKECKETARRIAQDHYADECAILARRKAIADRAIALEVMLNTDAAVMLQRCWRRGKAKTKLHNLAWLSGLRHDLARQNKGAGAALLLQRVWRGKKGREATRKRAASNVHARVDRKSGHVFYFNEHSGASSWEIPNGVDPATVPPPCEWALRQDHLYELFYFNSKTGLQRRDKPTGFRMCVQCEVDFATRRCETCLDAYCLDCFLKAHAKGQRRYHKHEELPVAHVECDWCPEGVTPAMGERFCETCDDAICGGCLKEGIGDTEKHTHTWFR